MNKSQVSDIQLPYVLKNYEAVNLLVESASLKENPLVDPYKRHNYVLVPTGAQKKWPVIFHLSGYFSTGFQQFQAKTLNSNFIQQVDHGINHKNFPKAIHVFVDASTYWGGSQFINSPGCGQYRDYLIKELNLAVEKHFSVSKAIEHWCVMGASSGGYGALQMISDKLSPFGLGVAIAPDSYFTASLLPELFQGASELRNYKNFKQIKKLIELGELQDKKSFFNLMNIIAMSHCYSPAESFKNDFIQFPIDLYTGEVNMALWKQWLKHDPVYFLKKRINNLKGKEVFLDVGKYDNFSLQFGARQAADILKQGKVKHHYSEFSGNHFGLSKRKLLFLETLGKKWKRFV